MASCRGPRGSSHFDRLKVMMDLSEIWKTQKSLTEWMRDINHDEAEALRREDNEKHQRLGILKSIIDLPYDEPTQFEATELARPSPQFKKFLRGRGEELCAIRMIPKEEGLPKIRMRGKSIKEAYEWFKQQDIDPAKYRADFLPHEHFQIWSTIFIVNKHGIQGEIISGGHHQLTQGFHQTATPHVFKYDFRTWQMSPKNARALGHVKLLADMIKVEDKQKKAELKKALGATFAHNYLEGYFETIKSKEFGTWYKDYSRTLGRLYKDLSLNISTAPTDLIKGQTGCGGQAEGKVVIAENPEADFPAGSVLVCKVTTPDFVPLMQKAAAIVTDQGGILSHAAIVARELKVPCVVATGNATQVLKTGQKILVDADAGVVTL